MEFSTIIGIDPGSNGGIAVWKKDSVQLFKMPEDIREVADILAQFPDSIVFLEKLSVRPDDIGIKEGMGKLYRIQRMIANFEQLKAVISLAGLPYILTHPMTWQSGLGLRIKGEPKAQRKKRYRNYAARLFPLYKVTMWNCDALLIMVFGRRALIDRPKWVAANFPKNFSKF